MDFIELSIGDDHTYSVPKTFGKYQYVRKIGYGTFSSVIMVRHIKTREIFACKVVSREMLVEQGTFLRFEQEVRLMQSFHHPYIVKTYDVVYDTNFIFIIMEYCPNGELFSYILSLSCLPEMEVNRLLRQSLQALQYIHEKSIAHRDIKPENLLLDADMNIKFCDFGLCKTMKKNCLLKTPCGSPFYAPPEVINNVDYDGFKSDIWSLGIVTYTMATGNLPWTETNQTLLFEQITNMDVTIPSKLSPPLQQILSMMLQRDPNKRPSAKELLEMPWLQEDSKDGSSSTPLKKNLTLQARPRYSLKDSLSQIGSKNRKSLIIRPDVDSSTQLSPLVVIRKVPRKSIKSMNFGSTPFNFESFSTN